MFASIPEPHFRVGCTPPTAALARPTLCADRAQSCQGLVRVESPLHEIYTHGGPVKCVLPTDIEFSLNRSIPELIPKARNLPSNTGKKGAKMEKHKREAAESAEIIE